MVEMGKKIKINIRKLKKITLWTGASLIILSICLMFYADYRINNSVKDKIFEDLTDVPYNKAGLLLGTSKYLKSGQLNLYFQYRIDACVALFNAHKIDFIVVSGDNSTTNYNEPLDMKMELIKRGIPENRIFLDYAGFRTFDSVIRMKEIFGQTSFTVISQSFHNQRAVFIAGEKGLNAVGYNAVDVNKYSGFKTNLREKFAKVKAILDIWFGKEPKFLGNLIELK